MHTDIANHHPRSSGERNGAKRRAKAGCDIILQVLELLQLVKRHVTGQSDVKQ